MFFSWQPLFWTDFEAILVAIAVHGEDQQSKMGWMQPQRKKPRQKHTDNAIPPTWMNIKFAFFLVTHWRQKYSLPHLYSRGIVSGNGMCSCLWTKRWKFGRFRIELPNQKETPYLIFSASTMVLPVRFPQEFPYVQSGKSGFRPLFLRNCVGSLKFQSQGPWLLVASKFHRSCFLLSATPRLSDK